MYLVQEEPGDEDSVQEKRMVRSLLDKYIAVLQIARDDFLKGENMY